jgi:hypothetical protein
MVHIKSLNIEIRFQFFNIKSLFITQVKILREIEMEENFKKTFFYVNSKLGGKKFHRVTL